LRFFSPLSLDLKVDSSKGHAMSSKVSTTALRTAELIWRSRYSDQKYLKPGYPNLQDYLLCDLTPQD
jgi:hypothetical protein